MKRIFLGKFVDFATAQSVKDTLSRQNPDATYQIRRIHNGFKLVKRVES